MEGVAVADAKNSGAPASKGASTPGDAGFVKDLVSSVEGALVADAKESGASDAKGASTAVDAGYVNSVAGSKDMACSLEASAFTTSEDSSVFVEVVAISVDACSAKDATAANEKLLPKAWLLQSMMLNTPVL